MSDFSELMATNPPRLVVLFHQEPGGNEQFKWGIAGTMPVANLIGAITIVQTLLVSGEWVPETDDQQALVITWDAEPRRFSFYMHPNTPTEAMAGMLEVIKAMLVASKVAQQYAANQTPILGPTGQPMRRSIQ